MKYFTINTFLTKGLNRLCPHAMEWVILVFVVNTNNIAHICWSAFLNINLKKVPQDMNNNLLIISVEALCLTSYITKSGPLQTCFIARQWLIQNFFGADRCIHWIHGWRRAAKFSKFVPLDTWKCTSWLCLFLDFLVKHSQIKFTLQNFVLHGLFKKKLIFK